MSKVVLVTGGATGIGAAAAKGFAARGVDVVINHLGAADRADAEQTAELCRSLGRRVEIVPADVGEPAACERLIAQSVAAFGRLDYLVNNAGYTKSRPLADLDSVDPAEFHRAFAVNCIGPFLLARYAAPRLRAAGGSIVNISSMAGLVGFGSSYPYLTSKAALINLTRSLARVLAPEVRVNVICPGLVDTPWPARELGDRFEAVAKAAAAGSPTGRLSTAADIATTILFLCMDAAQITGEVVRVDGGGHLGGPV